MLRNHSKQNLTCERFNVCIMAYLNCYVLPVSDVFDNFRKICIEYSKFDPTNYLIAPGIAWDAMLLQTKVKLDLITAVEMLSMIERQKRGGLCVVGSKRHDTANNKYIAITTQTHKNRSNTNIQEQLSNEQHDTNTQEQQ